MTNFKTIELTYHGVIYSKKNHKRIVMNRKTGQRRIISSPQALKNERDMVQCFQWAKRFPENKETFENFPNPPFRVEIYIWEKNFTRRDLDNQATSVLDALVKAGILPDDDFKTVAILNVKFMGIDRQDPRVVVHISAAPLGD